MKNVQNRARNGGGSRKEISTQQTLPDQHANIKSFTFKEAGWSQNTNQMRERERVFFPASKVISCFILS